MAFTMTVSLRHSRYSLSPIGVGPIIGVVIIREDRP
jgi:hypothetical protein